MTKGKLKGFDVAYTDAGATLTIEWVGPVAEEIENARSAEELSARTVSLLRTIVATTLAEIDRALASGDVTPAKEGA